MTKLNRKVSREVEIHPPFRPIIVEIDPETKGISLHEKGCHKKYGISIEALFILLVRGAK